MKCKHLERIIRDRLIVLIVADHPRQASDERTSVGRKCLRANVLLPDRWGRSGRRGRAWGWRSSLDASLRSYLDLIRRSDRQERYTSFQRVVMSLPLVPFGHIRPLFRDEVAHVDDLDDFAFAVGFDEPRRAAQAEWPAARMSRPVGRWSGSHCRRTSERATADAHSSWLPKAPRIKRRRARPAPARNRRTRSSVEQPARRPVLRHCPDWLRYIIQGKFGLIQLIREYLKSPPNRRHSDREPGNVGTVRLTDNDRRRHRIGRDHAGRSAAERFVCSTSDTVASIFAIFSLTCSIPRSQPGRRNGRAIALHRQSGRSRTPLARAMPHSSLRSNTPICVGGPSFCVFRPHRQEPHRVAEPAGDAVRPVLKLLPGPLEAVVGMAELPGRRASPTSRCTPGSASSARPSAAWRTRTAPARRPTAGAGRGVRRPRRRRRRRSPPAACPGTSASRGSA